MANLVVSGPQADYKRGMANQMMQLLRNYGSFEAIPPEKKAGYSRRIDTDDFGRDVIVIVALPPVDIHRELRDLESKGFIPPLPDAALLGARRVIRGHRREDTMDGFWKQMRWFVKDEAGRITLTDGKWKSSPVEIHYAAVRYLYTRVLSGKDPRQASRLDFEGNRLRTLLRIHDENMHELVSGAFPELNIMPWEMLSKPRGLFDSPEVCRQATRWLAEVRTGKHPSELNQSDYLENGLRGMLNHKYSGSPYRAVIDAYPELGLQPMDKRNAPKGTYMAREVRILAIRKRVATLLEETGKQPRDLTAKELLSRDPSGSGPSLSGISRRYYNSRISAMLFDAGLISEEDAAYMNLRYSPRGHEAPLQVRQRFGNEAQASGTAGLYYAGEEI